MIATNASLKIEWVQLPFEKNLDAINKGDVDIILSGRAVPINVVNGITLQEEQLSSALEIIELSESFLVNEALIFTASNMATKDIKTIGFPLGQIAFKQAEIEDLKDYEFTEFSTLEAAFSSLDNQQVDAILSPNLQSNFLLGGDDQDYKQIDYSYHEYRMAIRKDSELASRINLALQAIIDDGSYSTIYTKWFNKRPPYVYLPKDQRDDQVLEQAKAILDIGYRVAEIDASCLTDDYPDCKYQEMEEIYTELQALEVDNLLGNLYTELVNLTEISIPILENPRQALVEGSNAVRTMINWTNALENYIKLAEQAKISYVR